MKEALARVRQVEDENQDKKQELLQQLFLYQQEKEKELEEISFHQREERNQLLEEKQQYYQQLLKKQEQELNESLKFEDELNQRMYQKHYTEVITKIIKEVKQVNGSE